MGHAINYAVYERNVSRKGIGDATKTCYADAVGRKISCSDSETFEEIVNILRSAGYEVCGV